MKNSNMSRRTLLAGLLMIVLLPQGAFAQLSSPSFQMDINGVGEAGVGTTDGATTGVDSSGGPTFTISDTATPTVPTNLATTSVGETDVSISWTASTDDTGVASYEIYRDGVSAGTVSHPTTSFDDAGLSSNTAYSYTVLAVDVVGKRSATSSSLIVTTDEPSIGGGGLPGDDDGDGITNAVEAAICAAYPTLASCPDVSPTDDSDGDGITDVDEFINGTDPTDINDPNSQSTGGGGGSSSSSNDEGDTLLEVEEDPLVDVGVAITSLQMSSDNTAIELSGEVLDADSAIWVYFVRSATDSALACSGSFSRNFYSGTVGTGDTFSFTSSSFTPDTTYYYRLCAVFDGEIVAASAVESLTTPETSEVEEVLEADELVGDVAIPEFPLVPTTLGPGNIGTDQADGAAASDIAFDIQAQLRLEDATLDAEQLTLIINRHVSALVPDADGNYTLEAAFDNGEVARMAISGEAIGLSTDEEIIIVITQSALGERAPASQYRADLVTAYIYDVRVFYSDGREITNFNQPIQIVLGVPEPLLGLSELGVYFTEADRLFWERVPNVTFTEFEALFMIDHLTLFGIWDTDGEPAEMEYASGQTAEQEATGEQVVLGSFDERTCGTYLFGFIPVCWPWPLIYLALVALTYWILRRINR